MKNNINHAISTINKIIFIKNKTAILNQRFSTLIQIINTVYFHAFLLLSVFCGLQSSSAGAAASAARLKVMRFVLCFSSAK